MALPWCSDVRTCSCSGGVHRSTSSGVSPSPPAWSCGYCWYERDPLTMYYPGPLCSVFSNRRKFAQLVGSNFNRIINHCCFFIPKYSCQVSRPWVTYPFWALATPIKAQKISATSTFLSTIVREKPDEYNVHFKGVSLLPLTLPEAELAHCALDGHWIVGSSSTSALA